MKTAVLCLAVFLLAGCKDNGIETPMPIPVDQLLAVPTSLRVEGKSLYLATDIWRNFMPGSRSTLIALIFVSTADSSQFPATVSADAVWIVYYSEVWSSYFTDEQIPPDPQRPDRYARFARGGPLWEPGVKVDVIVRVYDGLHMPHLLRATEQSIGAPE